MIRTVVQIVFTVGALAIVLTKTNLDQLWSIISSANPAYLLGAILFFNLSKLINAFRLNRYFTAIDLHLSGWYNLKLYYLGMFYNLFLPGGIGGDGYKIYVLKKHHGLKVVNIFSAVFWDRISGIFALIFLSAALIIPSSFAGLYPDKLKWLWLVAGLTYPLSLLLTWLVQRQFMPVFFITAVESLLIQITQVMSAWFILMALSASSHQIDYLAIFLISSVATILPITIGGAGAREVTFYYALNHLKLDVNTGIALSLVFFGISAISALPGILAKMRHEPDHSLATVKKR